MTAREFRAARAKLGWSEAKMGVELGVVQRTVTRWESGEFEIPTAVEKLLKIATDPNWPRLRELVEGKPADDDPLGDGLDTFDQRVADLRALRAGRAPQQLPPGRPTLDRRPEGVIRTASETNDPLAAYDYDAKVRVARKRGPAPAADTETDGDMSDPLHGRSYDEGVRAARARRAKGDD